MANNDSTNPESTNPDAGAGQLLELAQADELGRSGVVAVRTRRDRIVVEGEDAATYLQGQLSQNVEAMPVSGTARALLLQPQGKVDSWMRVYRFETNTFWLDTDLGYGEVAMERLRRFMLRTKATLALAPVDVVALRGPDSQQAAEGFDRTTSVDANWSTMIGVDLFSDQHLAIPDGVAEGSPQALEVFRIRAGQPVMGAELGPSTIPAAAHVVNESVDFTKGCYVGQELVARIDSRGSATPKRLCGVVGSSATVPSIGSFILGTDGAEIGELTSVSAVHDGTSVGLAYIKRAVEVPCSATIGSDDGNTVEVQISALR